MLKKRTLLIMMLMGLFLAACSLTSGSSPEPVTAQPATESNEVQTEEPTPVPVEETEVSNETESEVQPTPTEQAQAAALPDQGPIPTGSSALKATDPASVNLAAGDPTLVEFFAFW